jgi:hypothetical protein
LHTPEGNYLVAPEFVANLGLDDRWELVLEGRHQRALRRTAGEPRSRILDTGLFLKTIIRDGALQNGVGTSLAIEFGALLPTLHDEDGIGASALLVASHRWRLVTAHFNGEVVLTRSKHVELVGGLIVEGRTPGPVRPVLEWVVEGGQGDSRPTHAVLLGAIWDASDRLSLDIAARAVHVHRSREYELRAGLTWTAAAKS